MRAEPSTAPSTTDSARLAEMREALIDSHRPARASLSLGELSRYHTMGGGSPGPRSEPMSRQRDQCAPHDRGDRRRRECMGSKSRSRIFRVSSVSDQPITTGTRICIQYRFKFHRRARDSSQMCDNKVHAQAACAPDEDTQSMAKVQSGRYRARPLRARAPEPGADRMRVPRCPRRYATCLWTPRCTRALTCDRQSSGSASSRRARLEWVFKRGRFAPAPARCRRQTRRRTHTAGLETPCCRVDHAWGTSARDRRAHSELSGCVGIGAGKGNREWASGRRRAPGRPTATGGRSAPAVRWRIPASRVLVDEVALILQDFGLGQHPSDNARAACTARHEQKVISSRSACGFSRQKEWAGSKQHGGC